MERGADDNSDLLFFRDVCFARQTIYAYVAAVQKTNGEGLNADYFYENLVSQLTRFYPELLDPIGVENIKTFQSRIKQDGNVYLRDWKIRGMLNPVYRYLKSAELFQLDSIFTVPKNETKISRTYLFSNSECTLSIEELVERFCNNEEYNVFRAIARSDRTKPLTATYRQLTETAAPSSPQLQPAP